MNDHDHDLTASQGRTYWRSLEELADTPAFRAYLGREFPENADQWAGDEASRRQFLRLMGASLALAGVSGGCFQQPTEEIVPYVKAPEEIVAGKPLFFATALPMDGYVNGVLVENQMGRPTKIEGNPDHPASLGATDPFMQASVLTLYDPDRSQVVLLNGRVSTWDDFQTALLDRLAALRAKKGAGLRIVTGPVGSPTLIEQLRRFKDALPEARWFGHDPIGRESARAGSNLAFGADVEPIYQFEKAEIVLALDADFLAWGPSKLRDARQFASRREAGARLDGKRKMNRLYVAEPSPTITGSMADHRLPIPSYRVGAIAQAIARALEVKGAAGPADLTVEETGWVNAVVSDLKGAKGSSLILVGATQGAEVHALGHALNDALGNIGQTVTFIEPIAAVPDGNLSDLVQEMAAGSVDTLLILGVNPVYDAPADLEFARALAKVNFSVHLGLYADETGILCRWHIPEAHPLESWGDGRAFDGTATIQQPLIRPLFGGKSALEILALVLGDVGKTDLQIVHGSWKERRKGDDKEFEKFWKQSLHDGIVKGTASEAKSVTLKDLPEFKPAVGSGLELSFRPDPMIWDGRHANNGWLQELPRPMTRLTWDNAAFVAPGLAKKLGITNDQDSGACTLIELRYRGRTLRMPAWIMPGQAAGSITIHLGSGRTQAGRVGNGAGFNAYALRTADAPWGGPGLEVAATASSYKLATTQHHQNMNERHPVRAASLADYRKKPEFAREPREEPAEGLTLYPQYDYSKDYAWGMAINLNTCIGCGACVVACVAENNIPVVGKEQVLARRNMHWIRVDRYYEGSAESPRIYQQPVPCMHCENAPCELVCPVEATVHDHEGLNVMVYNRCVGTRYCSNNCPYKVRRFNFLQYSDLQTESLKLQRNPNVTVRNRGVMEKCTYCTQRITLGRITAEMENRKVHDGEIVPACAQACPTRAIVFGDLNTKGSAIDRAKHDPRDYALLESLNTRPRTTYTARLENPNPALTPESRDGEHASS